MCVVCARSSDAASDSVTAFDSVHNTILNRLNTSQDIFSVTPHLDHIQKRLFDSLSAEMCDCHTLVHFYAEGQKERRQTEM